MSWVVWRTPPALQACMLPGSMNILLRTVLLTLAWLALAACSSLPKPIPPASEERSRPSTEPITAAQPKVESTVSALPPSPEGDLADVRAAVLAGLPALDCSRFPASRALPYTPIVLGKTLGEHLPMLDFVLHELQEAELSSIYALIPLIESQFQADPGNRGAVRGMWQFSTDTARAYGLLDRPGLDRRLDAVAGTAAARQHLKTLETEFGDWRLVLAAYNAGAYRVGRAVKASGRDLRQIELSALKLPRHTVSYIDRVGALACMIQQHDELSLSMQLAAAQRLRALPVAECVGTDPAPDDRASSFDWRAFNPLLRAGHRLPADFQLLLPASTQCNAKLLANLAASQRRTPMPGELYRVKAGDSLWVIARQFGVSIDDLLQWNQLRRDSTLQIGQRLRLAP